VAPQPDAGRGGGEPADGDELSGAGRRHGCEFDERAGRRWSERYERRRGGRALTPV
jgi:hypothetical protein